MTYQIPTNKSQLREMHSKVLALAERHKNIVTVRQRDIHNLQEQHKQIVASAPANVRHQLQAAYESELKQFRAEVARRSEGDRIPLLKEMNIHREQAVSAKSFMQNGRMLLAAYGLGSPQRSAIHSEVAALAKSPATLTSLANRARAEAGNPESLHQAKLLAACIISVVDAMPSAQRPNDFTTAELASEIMGPEVDALQAMWSEIDICFSEALQRDRNLVDPKAGGHNKIANAIARQGIVQTETEEA